MSVPCGGVAQGRGRGAHMARRTAPVVRPCAATPTHTHTHVLAVAPQGCWRRHVAARQRRQRVVVAAAVASLYRAIRAAGIYPLNVSSHRMPKHKIETHKIKTNINNMENTTIKKYKLKNKT